MVGQGENPSENPAKKDKVLIVQSADGGKSYMGSCIAYDATENRNSVDEARGLQATNLRHLGADQTAGTEFFMSTVTYEVLPPRKDEGMDKDEMEQLKLVSMTVRVKIEGV